MKLKNKIILLLAIVVVLSGWLSDDNESVFG